jgi:hypothetical protein
MVGITKFMYHVGTILTGLFFMRFDQRHCAFHVINAVLADRAQNNPRKQKVFIFLITACAKILEMNIFNYKFRIHKW